MEPTAPKRRRVACAPPLPADIPDDVGHPDGPDPWRFRVNPAACDIIRDQLPPVPTPPLAVTGLVEPNGEIDIPFDPVPRLRKRRNGWTPETQRAFIAALATCGSVTRAARAVGLSAKSAYKLLDAPGAASFASAWDQALANGVEALFEAAIDRATRGSWVPVARRGRVVRHEYRHNDRLAVALLSGRVQTVTDNRERASSRRAHRLYLACREAEEAERARQRAEVRAAHQELIERIEEERLNPPRPQPRVRQL